MGVVRIHPRNQPLLVGYERVDLFQRNELSSDELPLLRFCCSYALWSMDGAPPPL